MNKVEYLLACLVEECSEVQKAAASAMRFGLDDKGISEATAVKRLSRGCADLLAAVQTLSDERIIPLPRSRTLGASIEKSKAHILDSMEYARERGTLKE